MNKGELGLKSSLSPFVDKGKVVQVKIGGVKVGIAGMGDIVEAVGKMGLNSDEELAREILKRVQAANYVPDAAQDEYARDLLRFYKLRMGLLVEPLPYEGIPGVVEIKVLGPGCTRCRQLEKDVRNLLGEINVAADLEKIEDMNEFAEYNVVVTPALVINGQVKMAGKVPTRRQLKEWIEEAANA